MRSNMEEQGRKTKRVLRANPERVAQRTCALRPEPLEMGNGISDMFVDVRAGRWSAEG